MPEISLIVDARETLGSSASRRLRAAGRIPAVVYGHGTDPISVEVEGRALRAALSTAAGTNALLRLEMGSTHLLALAREIQRHPVKHTVSHVDFLIVGRDEVVQADIAINLVGDAVAVHRADGVVAQELFTLAVKAKPADLPSHLEVDITEFEIGHVVRVADLPLPAGVEPDLDGDVVVVIAQPPRVRTEGEIEADAAAEHPAGEAAAEAGDAES
jgi:large subunit ribosomal protein L25